MLRRSRVVIVVAFLLAAVAGCGSGPDPASGPGETGYANPSAGAATPAPEIAPIVTDLDPESIVARVNGTPIHAHRVTKMAQAQKLRMLSEGQMLPDGIDQDLLQGSLQMLIDVELMVQNAKKMGLDVDEEEIEAEIQAVRAQFATEDEYRKYLDESELTEQDVREEAERRMLMQAFQASVSKGQTVEEKEARSVYDDRPELFTEGEQVRAAQILIRSSKDDPPAKREEARKRIDEVYAKLEQGADFAQLATEYSEASTAANGGDLGFFPRGVMVPMFEEVAFTTEPGAHSKVFETLYGFNIIKVLDRREAVLKPFDEVKPWLMVQLARQKEQEALHDKVDELRGTSSIEILADELDPEAETADAGAEAAVGATDG